MLIAAFKKTFDTSKRDKRKKNVVEGRREKKSDIEKDFFCRLRRRRDTKAGQKMRTKHFLKVSKKRI
jgi:hypothetical protein